MSFWHNRNLFQHYMRRPKKMRSGLIYVTVVCFSSASPITVTTGDKVELSLYYEALCPYCENFILNYLYKIFDNGLISIVDLKLSPYGNAKIRSNGTIVCQGSYSNDSIKDDLRNYITIKLADYMMMMLVTAMYEDISNKGR
ncbi:putative gamma interferon inducible lysosomal thiol reductase GILT [Helianthus annuus]|uniref:Gamma interferon inducible lysosomal thiol reductase GILT n=1 Tax=Helianthus annuus TaxID=4232 RepID=A0A9K3NTT7_HELAN|nr:putative gamma interferon inducible lysosomal thiol reductase GILT [Helianthus annuus]